jgi:putative transposase
MAELSQDHSIVDLSQSAGMSRSSYYYCCKTDQLPDADSEIKQQIQSIYHHHKGRYGYRRIRLALRNMGVCLNHKTIQRLMGLLQLKAIGPKKHYRSYRGAVGKVAANMLGRNFKAQGPHQKWVTDVTEFNLQGEKIYLSPVLDLYNQEVVAYQIEQRPQFGLVMKMLSKAIKQLKSEDGPLLHSDQGWHYQMSAYQQALKDHGIQQSMSRKGNCLDNAVMENFFGILKKEFFYGKQFKNMASFKAELKQYIHYYNHDRIKEKLKGLSPVQYRSQSLVLA